MKKSGIVYRKAHGPFDYSAWPTVAKDENDVLYVVFSANRISHVDLCSKTYLVRSLDGGESWSLPTVVNDTELDDRDAGICYLGKGRFAISYFCPDPDLYLGKWNRHMLDYMTSAEKIIALGAVERLHEIPKNRDAYGSFVRITEDGFFSIGEPVKVPVSAPHGPISLNDGSIGYLGKSLFYDTGILPNDSLYYFKSSDGGNSFYECGSVPIPDGCELTQFHEPHVVDLGDGRLFGAYRAHGADGFKLTIYYTTSDDGGKTWETLRPSGLDGAPPHLLLLSDGRILLTYAKRSEPNRIEAVISSDGGKSFSAPITVEEFAQHSYEGDFGYPASVELSDGSIVTVYYAVCGDDRKPSIFYTKWSVS